MVAITKFQVSIDRKTIVLEITKGGGDAITSFTIADQEDYLKDLSTDLSLKIAALNANNTVIINALDLGVSILDGIYFLELEGTGITGTLKSVTANISQYFYCINDLLAVANTDCVDCNNGLRNVITADLFLEGMKSALYLGRYTEAINHFYSLNKLCINRCDACSSVSGTFGVLNGDFIIA